MSDKAIIKNRELSNDMYIWAVSCILTYSYILNHNLNTLQQELTHRGLFDRRFHTHIMAQKRAIEKSASTERHALEWLDLKLLQGSIEPVKYCEQYKKVQSQYENERRIHFEEIDTLYRQKTREDENEILIGIRTLFDTI